MAIEILGYGLDEVLPYLGFSIFDGITALIALIVGIIIVKMVSGSLRDRMIATGLKEVLAEFTSRLMSIILYIFVVLISLTFLGLEMGAMLVSVSAVLGLVIGLALSDTLGNIASGFMMAIVNPFDKGDFVEVSGKKGTVKAVGISVTALDTPNNERVVLPNKEVWGSSITNYSEHPIRRIDLKVGVSYDDDLDKAIEAAMELLDADDRVLSDPEPQVAVDSMGDSAVILIVRPWVNSEEYWGFYRDYQKALKQKYDEIGIEFPYPQMDVHLDEGSGE